MVKPQSNTRRVLQSISNAESVAIQGTTRNAQWEGSEKKTEIDNQLESFKHLSQTISKNITQSGDLRKKEDKARAKAIFMDESLELGMDPEARDKYNAGKATLAETDTQLNEASLRAQKAGASYHEAAKLHGLSGWGLHEYVRLRSAAAAGNMEDWIKGQMLNNEDLQVTYGGETFTPNKADTLEKKAAAINALREKYFIDTDLINVSDDLLAAEGHYETMSSGVSNVYAEYEKVDSVNKSNQRIHTAQMMFQEDGDLGKFITAVASQRDTDGNLYDHEGALDHVITKKLKDMFDAGTLTPELYESMKNQEVPWAKGKKFGEYYKTRFNKLEEVWIEENINNSDNWVQKAKLKGAALQNRIVREAQEIDPNTNEPRYMAMTDKDWDELEDKINKESLGQHDIEPFQRFREQRSVSAEAERRMNIDLEELSKQGLLDVTMLDKLPLPVRNKWLEQAQTQTQRRAQNKGYKAEVKSLEAVIKKHLSIEALEEKGPIPTLIHQELTTMFMEKATTYQDLGIENAVQRALLETQDYYNNNSEDGSSGKYAVDQHGNHTNYRDAVFAGSKSKNDAILARHNEILTAIEKKEGKELQDYLSEVDTNTKEPKLFTKQELKAMEEGYGEDGWEMDTRVNLYARRFGMNPFEIINKQRKAAGLKEMKPPDLVRKTQEQALWIQAILGTNNSFPRSTRGHGSENKFSKEVVPKNHGETIENTSKTNNVPPNQAAAFVETLGGWNNDEQWINNQCSVIGRNIEAFNGDVDSALLDLFPDIDLKTYHKAAYKYGGGTEELNNQWVLRESVLNK